MLPKPHRLPTPDVRQVMRSGRRLTSPFLIMIYRNNTIGTARFAVVVPKSVDKMAVGRNRIKRLVRESVYHLLPSIAQNIDGVIIVRRKVETLEEAENGIRELVLHI